ncbi:thiol reductant ABC exporter subunit CydC [Rhodobacteraceae bacterium RKSG542]|uniref:thiol reductant ABC exporter subunit CydC n=1 Tax=Pseudovibrio flavus TaxID=2529854 RepID=UPI0012BD30D5|nr:thiol reductant ABC exporter subunit CydC [Pseudovibrio flavus]MTI16995.1 thiol reductant ABC exporter subunit CydC [Pseudovibrio flavus]
MISSLRASGSVIWRLQKQAPFAFWFGLHLCILPTAAGIALLAISGWFMTSAALAGLAGAGLAFNYSIATSNIRLYAAVRILGRYLERLVTHDTTFRFLERLRTLVFRGVVLKSIKQGAGRQATALSRIVSDVEHLDGLYLRLAVPLFSSIAVSAITLYLLWVRAPFAVLTIGLLQGVGLLLLARLSGERPQARAKWAAAVNDALRVRTSDMVRGRRDLSVYGGLERQRDAVQKAADAQSLVVAEQQEKENKGAAIVAGIGQAMVALTFLFAALSYAQGHMELKYIALFVLIAFALPETLSSVAAGVSNWHRMSAAAKRVEDLVEAGTSNHALFETGEELPEAAHDKLVSIKALSYGWPKSEKPVLADVDLELKSGSRTAIIGASGSGKSTLASIIARLVPVEQGTVLFQGVPLEQIDEASLRDQLVMVGQRTQIFHDTVAANLRIANPMASDDDLWLALERAGLKETITAKSNQLEEVLGEGGLGLSGGEARRLSLARAFLKKPKLWIADELTEGLDEATARSVLQSFFEMTKDQSVLVISHRAIELQHIDRLLVLEEGRLNEAPLPLDSKTLARLRED